MALLSTATDALVTHLTRIPLGKGTATITWTGATGTTPSIKSVKGAARGYAVSAVGHTPRPASVYGTSSTIPSNYPIANVEGTIGGAHFTLGIVLTLPGSLNSNKTQSIGHVNGTFRNQKVVATLAANINSSSFKFTGTIGSLHVSGVVSQPIHHGKSETARASFDVTR